MESHLSRNYTLAELQPGMPEDLASSRSKSSPRMQGSMVMNLRRVSRSPENSRIYVHGDPIRLIDWKAYARTDELIVREHRDEASARVAIVLDQSDTLNWPSPESIREHKIADKVPQKMETAVRVALYLAYAHLTMGDSVTVGFLDHRGDVSRVWVPRSPTDVLGMYQLCLTAGFSEALDSFMISANWTPQGFNNTWWISDFLAKDVFPPIWKQVRRLAVVHVFSWLESQSSWMDGGTTYRDETRGRKIYLGDQLKTGDDWAAAIEQWQKKVEKSVKKLGGVYLAADDRTNVGDFFHWLTTEAVR
jgi:Protein of unknown function DUF58